MTRLRYEGVRNMARNCRLESFHRTGIYSLPHVCSHTASHTATIRVDLLILTPEPGPPSLLPQPRVTHKLRTYFVPALPQPLLLRSPAQRVTILKEASRPLNKRHSLQTPPPKLTFKSVYIIQAIPGSIIAMFPKPCSWEHWQSYQACWTKDPLWSNKFVHCSKSTDCH